MGRIITSVKLECGETHDRVHVWNRGGKAGVLTVQKGDGPEVLRMLGGSATPKRPPKPMGYCEACKQPVMHGDETWGYFKGGEWVLTHDGYLHHKWCGR